MTTWLSILGAASGAAAEAASASAAASTVPASQPQQAVPWWAALFNNPMVPILVIMVLFLVMTMRSKRRQDRERQSMLDQLKRGDRVQTIGGVLGTVVEARPDEILLKVDESSNTKIRFARSAIHRVLDAERSSTSSSSSAASSSGTGAKA